MRTLTGGIAVIATLTSAPIYAAEPVDPAPPTQSPEQSGQAAQGEQAIPIVMTCINAKAEILSVEIVQTSGFPELDNAALKVARNAKYAPGTSSWGRKQKKSCVKFKVRFVIKDGEQFPVEIAAPPVTSRT